MTEKESTVREGDQFLCNISLRLLFTCFSTRSKRVNEEIYLVILSRRKTSSYAIFHIGYNTKSKGVNEEIILCFTVHEEDQFLCKISGSFFASFTCFYMVVACIIMNIVRTIMS